MPDVRSIGRLLVSSALALLIVIAGGCSSTSPPSTVDPTIDELIEASGVPAFAGLQVDEDVQAEDAKWTVFLFDESRREDARQALREIFGERASLIRLAVRPDEAQIENDVADQVREAFLEIEGVAGTGYGGPGHLKVYVAEVAAVRRVQETLPGLSVPQEAVVIHATGRFEAL